MNTSYRRSSSPFRIPGYNQNAVLQLIVATGIGFILYQASKVTLIVFGVAEAEAQGKVLPLVALPAIHQFATHAWTLLTYGWAHAGFWEWLTNMIWLYTFGNVLQNLVGHRQVIPTFIYGLTLGGLFCLAAQFIPGLQNVSPFVMTSNAGVMALAAATVTVAPKYRFYLGENFSIPLLVVVGIYLALNLLVAASHLPMLALCIGGLLAGYLTMLLLRRGYHPGAWMYNITGSIGRSMNPDEEKLHKIRQNRRRQTVNLARRQADQKVTQQRIDEILEKIHQRGQGSLSAEEREMLMKASKETQD